MSEVRCVVESNDILGEGPAWIASEGRVYWFDIKGAKLNWLDHATGATGRFDLPTRASVMAPRKNGGLILVTETGLAIFDTANGRFDLVQPMTFERGFRTNDGKIDVAGRLWWSTMDDNEGERTGALFRTDPDGTTRQVLDGIHISNTVSCSPDGQTMYFADSVLGLLWAFPILADGSLGERRVFASTKGERGAPDGSAVDAEGYVWNAQWGAWRIVRFAPDGRIDRIVEFPVEKVSSCIFGGPDLRTMYVTTASENLDAAGRAAQPLAGNLFAFDPGVAGLPLPTFDGEIGVTALLVCDWGSTNLRAWTIDAAGAVLARDDFPFGVNRLAPGEAAGRFRNEVRPRLGAEALPALLCGAIGSNIGWREAPYVDCPATLEAVAAGVIDTGDGVWIIPGLRCDGPGGACDVLRGEETKALGWLQLAPEYRQGRHLVCQPGTHPKWMIVDEGRIVGFQSAFTGELFAVLSAHSILRNDGAADDPAAFDAGLKAAAEGDALLNRIYTARSRIAGGGAAAETTGAYLSGLLIGAEAAATPRLLGLEGEPVVLLGERQACDRYARALTRRGTPTSFADGEAAARAGLVAIARLKGLL